MAKDQGPILKRRCKFGPVTVTETILYGFILEKKVPLPVRHTLDNHYKEHEVLIDLCI